tara:strand:+ start:212 stop:961 length:750 start_codon:yes stop_codon:yes gene_type:complete
MKKFNYLNNDELLKEIDRYTKIIKKFQDPIDNYDLHYDNFLKAKKNNDFSQNNPIICSNRLITKETANGSYYIKGLGEEHFEEVIKETTGTDNDGIYVLTKEGNRISRTQQMELFVKRKRQIELILRGRKRDKEKNDNLGYLYVLSNKAYPNIYKIGSTYNDVDERAEELTGTGHLMPFKVEAQIQIKSAEYYEKKIHSILSSYRVKQNREFFEIDLDKVKSCLNDLSRITDKGEKKLSLTDLKKGIVL